jgi:hypothetical protein
VVYGFWLTLQDDILLAAEGMAFTATGQPLQSDAPPKLPLDSDHLPPLDQDGFWLVVLDPATEASGSENAYGTVCTDPCEGIGTIKPWLSSLVTQRLRARTMTGLGTVDNLRRRSWLASEYLESESRGAKPWVVTGGAVGLLGNPWAEGGTPPDPNAVLIGVL